MNSFFLKDYREQKGGNPIGGQPPKIGGKLDILLLTKKTPGDHHGGKPGQTEERWHEVTGAQDGAAEDQVWPLPWVSHIILFLRFVTNSYLRLRLEKIEQDLFHYTR